MKHTYGQVVDFIHPQGTPAESPAQMSEDVVAKHREKDGAVA